MNELDEEKRFISMLSDYGFKVTFGNENHPRFLRKALQALIDSDVPIRSVQFTKNEITATTKDSRGGLFDITCEDDQGRVFIVEMQLLDLSNMIHRVKFYAFHRYNIMVKKGNFRFNNLKKIYTISILAGKTYQTGLYHQIGTIKNQHGELIDDQITHVIVELDKFQKTLEQIETNLDKLLYTMKLTDTANKDVTLPDFMREGWLEETLEELDRANLTPEQRAEWEIAIAGNMSEKMAREEEKEKIRREVETRVKAETEKRVRAETEKRVKAETEKKAKAREEEIITKAIQLGILTDAQIADINDVSISLVRQIRKRLDEKK